MRVLEPRNRVKVREEWIRKGDKVFFRQKFGNLDWEPWRELAMQWPFADHVESLSQKTVDKAEAK